MAKNKPIYVCSDCGESFPNWLGKCSHCGAFNTLKVFREAKMVGEKRELSGGVDLSDLAVENSENTVSEIRIPAQEAEIDRVLGGGFFPGSVTLFGGHPGIGKSTLSLQIFTRVPGALYFSGEESRGQVLNRAKRLLGETLVGDMESRIFSTNSLEDLVATVSAQKPTFVVVDSIQMIGSSESSFGSMTQIRENAEVLIKLAKTAGITMLIIGHVTKNDELAGPKVLEHLVDTVLYLEGERNSELRLLRAPKNRFGSTLEVGVFEMQSGGLKPLENPSEFFLSQRQPGSFGSVVTVVRDGVRNFVLELQVLTLKTNFGQPRRTSHGLELSKFHLLLAVVSKFTPLGVDQFDAYCNVVGGLKVQDQATDLAVIAATLSSRLEKDIPANMVILGEVGLSGEVRRVPNLDSRLRNLAKLGFKKVICPPLPEGCAAPENLEVVEVRKVADLVKGVFGG